MDRLVAADRPQESRQTEVKTAVSKLRNGGLVAIPTDTLYALAASAIDGRAVERLYRVKGRPKSMPLPLLLADPEDISLYAIDIPDLAWRLVDRFFPGGLTLVLRSAGNVSPGLTGGLDTVGLRVADHWVPRAVARELGAPITGTSANRTGFPGPATAGEVSEQLGSDVDFVLDAGRSPGGVPSTVLDVAGPRPIIRRQGSIARQDIERVCGQRVAVGG